MKTTPLVVELANSRLYIQLYKCATCGWTNRCNLTYQRTLNFTSLSENSSQISHIRCSGNLSELLLTRCLLLASIQNRRKALTLPIIDCPISCCCFLFLLLRLTSNTQPLSEPVWCRRLRTRKLLLLAPLGMFLVKSVTMSNFKQNQKEPICFGCCSFVFVWYIAF